MAEEQQTLESLLVDEQEVSEELLTDLLSEYVRIGKDSGALITQEKFRNLAAKQKIAIVLLAQRARFELGMVEDEWLTPTEVSEQSGVKKGTVYPRIRELSDEGLVEGDDGNYQLPSRNFERAREYTEGDDNE